MAGTRAKPLPTAATVTGTTASAQYANQMTPEEIAAQEADNRRSANALYLMKSIPKVAICYPTSGGVSQAYAAGQTLTYDFPTASGAFAKSLLITCTLTNTIAGTGAFALNAGAPYTLIDNIQILYNGTQARLRPYILKPLSQLRGFMNPAPSGVNAGQADAYVTTQLNSTLPVAVAANTWTFVFRLPLNALHELSPIGMLPIAGAGTKAQVLVQCASNALGNDPILNAVSVVGGAGNSSTISGTIKVEAIYTDGVNMWEPNPVALALKGEPTAQYIIDTPLTPIAAGIVQRQRIQTLLQHYYVLATIVDGNQATKFATNANILGIELDQDSVGQNKFFAYGNVSSNNVSMNDFFEAIRTQYGQDLDEGIVPWVVAPGNNTQDPSNREGIMVLNMTPGGWSDVHHGYLLNSVGGLAGAIPRVELHLVSLNPAGLLQA